MGTWLEFDRVINADRASSCDPLRAGWQFNRVINADRASMMQSPAGRYSMQLPGWIPGPAAANIGKSINSETVGTSIE
jgi:hypothetical protein